MAISYPGSLDSFTNPTGVDLLENATEALDHDVQHSNANDAIEALEAKVGADSSAVTTSHDYKLSGVTGSDKAASLTGTETLSAKTLTSPVINVTSDATGDIYYRSSGGAFTRLAIGSNTNILAVSASGIPEWIANPDTSYATTTTSGISELATSAEIDAGTATGGSGGPLVVTPDQLVLSSYAIQKFGGDGSDGALTLTSGATDIDLGGSQYVIKDYTSISITGTGQLTFSNPHANGTIIVLKSQGEVTLTSSTIPNIDASGMGGSGGSGGAAGSGGSTGSVGTQLIVNGATDMAGQGGASAATTTTAGVVVPYTENYTLEQYNLSRKSIAVACGSGGGGGGGTQNIGTPAAGQDGGNGGGALIVECRGALNFTSTLGISVAGADGGESTNGEGGGGGGAGGMAVVLYNTLTAASGTVDTTGGAGGDATGNNTTVNAGGAGGSGAGSVYAAGGNGGKGGTNGASAENGVAGGVGAGGGGGGGKVASTGSTTTGGAGGSNTDALVALNTEFI